MKHIKGEDRRQYVLFPACLDEYIEQDNPVRYIDAFVDSLDLEELGFNHTKRKAPENGGRPSYDPSDILKLLIYGYFNSIRSSRKLAKACVVNIKVMWLLSKVPPDFRTVSDFRKDNLKPIKKVFKSLNKQLDSFGLFSHSYLSIDGSKFKAVNSRITTLLSISLMIVLPVLKRMSVSTWRIWKRTTSMMNVSLAGMKPSLIWRWSRTVRRITKNIVINWRKVERNNFHSQILILS